MQSGVSIAAEQREHLIPPAAGAETFAFLASAPLEPASLDVVDEWLAAQDEGARHGRTPARPDSELQLFLGDESPTEARGHKPASVATAKGDSAEPHQTRTPDDALQLWFGDAEPPSGDVDTSEKKAPSKEKLRGDSVLGKKWPVSRLIH